MTKEDIDKIEQEGRFDVRRLRFLELMADERKKSANKKESNQEVTNGLTSR